MNRSVSVLMPALNEAENLAEIIPELCSVLEGAGIAFDVLVVDDGSTDATAHVLSDLSQDPRVRSIRLRRNFGKSAALQAGFAHTSGNYVLLMDADGQDDPNEIATLVATLDEGFDLVTGSRRSGRRDRFIKRTTSRLFNSVTKMFTGVPGTDFNSGLKAMRRAVVDQLHLYGELHRYIPVLAHWAGFRVTEVPVNHRERRHGVTKFGSARFWRGFLDLLTVQFITRFTARPLHLFGGVGILFGLVGAGLLSWMLVLRLTGQAVGNRPALITGVLLAVLAVQFVSIGLIGELIVHSSGRSESDRLVSERVVRTDSHVTAVAPEPAPRSSDIDR
jgi:glycosyltransferase involved in cell wall biosynthesis